MNTQTVIIGVGFAGLCMAIKLKQAGYHDFLILEKADEVGGTWRENTYPGAECDIPTALYSYSFEQNPDWDYKWAEQSQILDYIKAVANKHGIYKHIRFGQQLSKAHFDESRRRWLSETADGNYYESQFLVSAVGQLHHPQWPTIPGIDDFSGRQFHSAQWDHSVDLRGKKVAVIGTGASAIQFVPPVVEQAAEVHVFQRSANWILPKLDQPYSDRQKQWRARLPLLNRWDRLSMWLRSELGLWPAMNGSRLHQWILKLMCLHNLRKEIECERKRAKLTPDYTVGAKRILFSDDYYHAINKPHCHLHTASVNAIEGNSLICVEERIDDFDVLIFGTGFITNPFLSDMQIQGREGKALHEAWSDGAKAYLGMSCAGFPNFFMLYGPNTNLGHNSIILMIEAQAKYIVQSLQLLEHEGKQCIEVRDSVEQQFNTSLQNALNKTVWAQADSWYTDRGRITNNWHGSTAKYRRDTRQLQTGDFLLS